jgi:methionine synthase II (cobalamin-independent)
VLHLQGSSREASAGEITAAGLNLVEDREIERVIAKQGDLGLQAQDGMQ